MGVDNRLTADQLTALEPGDVVTIESEVSLGRPRHATGTVVRVTGPDIMVKVRGRHGVAHQERSRRRDGVRVGGVSRAELVNASTSDAAETSEERRRVQRIHNLYRAWTRNRGDAEALRQLHAAIGRCLDELPGGSVKRLVSERRRGPRWNRRLRPGAAGTRTELRR